MKIKSLLIITVLAVAVFCFSTPIKVSAADCMSQLFSLSTADQITCLTQKIAELTSQIQAIQAQQGITASWCHTFNIYTYIGTTNATTNGDVSWLQTALTKEGFNVTGDDNGTFGESTVVAVTRFQAKYGIQQTGAAGPITRAKLNALYGCAISCTPNWETGAWSTCTNGQQTRTFTDLNNCGLRNDQIGTTQLCVPTCTPNWEAGAWSTCTNGQQTRIVTDLNDCRVQGILKTQQSCIFVPTCTPNWKAGAWSTCTNGQQTRTVADLNNCGVQGVLETQQLCTTACSPNWTCSDWNTCLNNNQTRTCIDSNNCGVTNNQFATVQVCVLVAASCTPNWQTGAWSTCTNGQQTRIATDLRGCGVSNDRPIITQSCACTPNWSCGNWSSCVNKQMTRSCNDLNNCGVEPDDSQTCSATACTPKWQVSAWSSCIPAISQRQRNVTDSNSCNVLTGKPAESEYCFVPPYIYNVKIAPIVEQGLIYNITWASEGLNDPSGYSSPINTLDIVLVRSIDQREIDIVASVPANSNSYSWEVSFKDYLQLMNSKPSTAINNISDGAAIAPIDSVATYKFKISVPGWPNAVFLSNSFTISKGNPANAPSVKVTASPTAIVSGGSTMITWVSNFANRCNINYSIYSGGSGVAGIENGLPPNGSMQFYNIKQSTTYKVTCWDAVDTANALPVTVSVGSTISCTPNWACMGFANSACVNGIQTQICTALNDCLINKPTTTQSCTTIIPQTVTLTSPTGGEQWAQGSTHDITWITTGLSADAQIKIVLKNDDSGFQYDILTNPASSMVTSTFINYTYAPFVLASSGKYSWTIPQFMDTRSVLGSKFKIFIFQVGHADIQSTSNYFTIIAPTTQPTIIVTSPNGGESWKVGETHNITWTSTGLTSSSTVNIAITGGSPGFPSIAINVPVSAGTYSWTIPAQFSGVSTIGNNLKIFIMNVNSSITSDYSDAPFTIAAAPLGLNVSQSSLASISDAIAAIIKEIQAMLNK